MIIAQPDNTIIYSEKIRDGFRVEINNSDLGIHQVGISEDFFDALRIAVEYYNFNKTTREDYLNS